MTDILGLTREVDPNVDSVDFLGDSNTESPTENKQPIWRLKQNVEVYSRSKDKWISAVVKKIMTENGQQWVQVYYKNSTQMKDVRADSGDIRAMAEDSARNSSQKSAKRLIRGQDHKNQSMGTSANYTHLLHKVSTISKQVEGGLYLIKRIATILQRISSQEIAHFAASKKILDQEQQKLKDKMYDEMSRCVDAWNESEEYLRMQLTKRCELAERIQNQIVSPMMEFFQDSEIKRKAILKDERKYGVEMNRAKVGVKKNLKNCQKLIDSCILAKAEEDQKRRPSAAKKKNRLGGMISWVKSVARGSLIDLQKQAATAAKNYSHSIDYANERQHQYFTKDLILICKQFEMLERSRINALHKYLRALNNLSREHAKPLIKLTEDTKLVVEKMNADQDIHDYTINMVRMYGPVPPIEPYTYQLNCTLNDIKAGRFKGNPNSFFYSTLEHCMEMQEGKFDLDVPVILVNLVKAVKDLGGHNAEGIFRLSALQDDLKRLRKQFDKGDYTIREKSPHVPAGLLKQWLRELAEPLIPTDRYTEAIKIAKSDLTSLEAVESFIKSMPKLNQRVVQHIGIMAGEIASKSSVNKMTFSNLAIVFAPGMLRNPSEDPAEMLENTKFESKFSKAVLEATSLTLRDQT